MPFPSDHPVTSIAVERATASDTPNLITVWWDAFSGDFIERIYPHTPDGRQWLERAFAKNFGSRRGPEEPVTECVIVRDPDDGCEPVQRSWRARWPAFGDLPGMQEREDVLAGFFDPMEKTQTYLLEDRGYIYLEALGTREAHRKRGYATALIKWGTDLADRLGLECYLDASPAGKPLYEAHGYTVRDVSAVVQNPAGSSMVRPVQQQGQQS
ncbi:hypothetical protein AAE478_007627 [Parahypoxylon ruwenzoriense]